MKKQLVATALLLFVPIFYVSCVSSILKDAPPTFSSEIKVTDPVAPFVKTKTSVFPSWKSSKSGNVISVVSDCDPNSNLTLQKLHQLVEDSLYNLAVLKEETQTFQGRPSFYKRVSGELDGRPIEVISISFKRKACGYVSSLSGKKETLEQDLKNFETFNNGLRFE